MRSTCDINRDLLKDIASKLTEIHALMKSQQDARNRGEAELRNEFTQKLDVAFKAKDRCVEAWQRHYREHGC